MHFLFLGFGDLDIIDKALRLFLMFLCKGIYKLIANVFQLFTTVSRLNILSSQEIAPIYQRVTMILTIVMVFYVTFEFVKYVIEPDTFSDKEKGAGKLVYRMIMVVLLIAFVPKIFSIGYQFQNKVIENQVLSKIILGKKSMNFKSYGYDFSANVLGLFYSVDEEICGSKCSEAESLVNTNLERLRKTGDTKYLDDSLNEANKVTIDGETRTRPIINFDGLFAVLVGGFIVYILILYSIDVGTRYAQLIFLQIMSPVAIISYISPKKDGMFSKWTKQCVTTYIDLFIRIAIIYFVLLIIQVLGAAYDNGHLFEGLGELSGFMKVMCYIVLVMGLLVFANKAPKMLSELLPSSGAAGIGFGIGAKERNLDRLAGAALGTAAGAGAGLATGIGQGWRRYNSLNKNGIRKGIHAGLWGATKGAIGGTIGGATRGLWNGAKKGNPLKNGFAGAKNQIAANQKFGNREEAGYTFMKQAEDRARSMFGAKSRIEELEEKKKPIKSNQEIHEKIKKAQSEMDSEAEKQVEKGKSRLSGKYAVAKKKLQNMEENQNFREEVRKELLAKTQEETIKSEEFRNYCSTIDKDASMSAAEKTAAKQQKLNETINKIVNDNAIDSECAKKLTDARKDVKEKLDEAKYDLITYGEYDGKDYTGQNARIQTIRNELETDIRLHNNSIPNETKIILGDDQEPIIIRKIDLEMVKEAMENGKKFDALIKGKSGTPYEGKGINDLISNDRNNMAKLDSQIAGIKGQTSNSGIGEGKK